MLVRLSGHNALLKRIPFCRQMFYEGGGVGSCVGSHEFPHALEATEARGVYIGGLAKVSLCGNPVRKYLVAMKTAPCHRHQLAIRRMCGGGGSLSRCLLCFELSGQAAFDAGSLTCSAARILGVDPNDFGVVAAPIAFRARFGDALWFVNCDFLSRPQNVTLFAAHHLASLLVWRRAALMFSL